jgi:ankyrin repeat protein
MVAEQILLCCKGLGLLLQPHHPTFLLARPQSSGETPLLIAIRQGHEEIAELLLHSKADVNAADKVHDAWRACMLLPDAAGAPARRALALLRRAGSTPLHVGRLTQ